MEAPKELYCVCGQPYDDKKFMIQCDNCREWYHGNCVNVREYVSIDLDKYHCPHCEAICGPSVFKKQYNFHRHNYSDMEAENKPVQTGTPVFIEELKTRHFPSAEPVITKVKGHQLTMNHLYENGFDQPIIIEEKEGLDIRVPSEFFTVQDVEALVGSDREVDVIDVARQSDIKMSVGDFVNYFNNPMRQRVLNLISLEFSNTKLSELVQAPYVARKLDWVNNVWPLSIGTLPTVYKRPEVQKYCLIGVKDSYTDFHIDFGGTSVWYHVLRGEKIFYLIKPTMANLSLYQRWMNSSTQHETFFGDQTSIQEKDGVVPPFMYIYRLVCECIVDCCYRCIVQAGHTMMIPTGWIHAVLTPVDTVVFGGNFLHSLNIAMQLQVYEIEKKIKTPEKFRFPAFETVNWYAAKTLCEELKMLNDESSKVPAYLLRGVKALLVTLKQWSQDRDTNKSRKEEIPSIIDGPKLLKDLSKEIRHAEKYLNSLHPPKPERESKRKKKKPVNKDFVDYSQPQNSVLLAQIEKSSLKKGNGKSTRGRVRVSEGPSRRTEVGIPKKLLVDWNRNDGDPFNRVEEPNNKSSLDILFSKPTRTPDIMVPKSTHTATKYIQTNTNVKKSSKKPRRQTGPKSLTYPYSHSSTSFGTEDGVIEIKYPKLTETTATIRCTEFQIPENHGSRSEPVERPEESYLDLECDTARKPIIPAQEVTSEQYKIEGPSKDLETPLPQLLVHLFETTSSPWHLVEGPKTNPQESRFTPKKPAFSLTVHDSHDSESHDHTYAKCICYLTSTIHSSFINENIDLQTFQPTSHGSGKNELIGKEYSLPGLPNESANTDPVFFESGKIDEGSSSLLNFQEKSEGEFKKIENTNLHEMSFLSSSLNNPMTSSEVTVKVSSSNSDLSDPLMPNFCAKNELIGKEYSLPGLPNESANTDPVFFESGKIDEGASLLLYFQEKSAAEFKKIHNRNLENSYDPMTMSEVTFEVSDFLSEPIMPNNEDSRMKMEPKEPIKLNMKMLSKKLQIKEDSVVRPPLKLTLPKPVMYPYTTPLCENKQKKEEIIEQPGAESKSWFIAMDRSHHVKMKTELIGLKVKLAKQAELPFINLTPTPPVHPTFQDDFLEQKHQIESVYDFHDDEDFPDDEDDNCLTIDESPKKRRWSKGSTPVEQASASLKAKWAQANHTQIHLNNLLMNLKGVKTEDLNSVDLTSELPKNGIDELLKASGYTRDESPRIEEIETGRTSPSTREAIAGMLSISRIYPLGEEGEPSSSNHRGTTRAKRKKSQTPHVDEVEDIDKVHQDDDFIYPSLDLSDEEEEKTTRGGKRKVDEAWNPKARVGHVSPKTDRPCREGAKKQSVEKGLEAAAAKRATLPSPKRPYHRKKPKFVPLPLEQPSSSNSSLLPLPSVRPVTTVTTVDFKNRKPKKGMATAKQRLGKILKLHKMYH